MGLKSAQRVRQIPSSWPQLNHSNSQLAARAQSLPVDPVRIRFKSWSGCRKQWIGIERETSLLEMAERWGSYFAFIRLEPDWPDHARADVGLEITK